MCDARREEARPTARARGAPAGAALCPRHAAPVPRRHARTPGSRACASDGGRHADRCGAASRTPGAACDLADFGDASAAAAAVRRRGDRSVDPRADGARAAAARAATADAACSMELSAAAARAATAAAAIAACSHVRCTRDAVTAASAHAHAGAACTATDARASTRSISVAADAAGGAVGLRAAGGLRVYAYGGLSAGALIPAATTVSANASTAAAALSAAAVSTTPTPPRTKFDRYDNDSCSAPNSRCSATGCSGAAAGDEHIARPCARPAPCHPFRAGAAAQHGPGSAPGGSFGVDRAGDRERARGDV